MLLRYKSSALFIIALSLVLFSVYWFFWNNNWNISKTENILKQLPLEKNQNPKIIIKDEKVTVVKSDGNIEKNSVPMKLHSTNTNVHAFYYAWYGTPSFDNRYLHWNHPILPHWDNKISAKYPIGERHIPPNDIGSMYYPYLGAYSSQDKNAMNFHMQQFNEAGIGVVALSWYPPGKSDDEGKPFHHFVRNLFDSADRYNIKFCIHMEPFNGNLSTISAAIKYIVSEYGNHPAMYKKEISRNGVKTNLPMVYFYDSYTTPINTWKSIFSPSGMLSIRGTMYDIFAVGLIVEKNHKFELKSAGFDGMYSYFAVDGFSYGSSWKNWNEINNFAKSSNMIFIPSVGPGYDDTKVRPWNSKNTRPRNDGKYYEQSWNFALSNFVPEIVSITSFNEWHEGTQIEAAISKDTYLSYKPHDQNYYITLTRKWSDIFSNKKST